MRKCSACAIEKSDLDFRDRPKKSKAKICRSCECEKATAHYRKNRERLIPKMREYRLSHLSEIREQRRRHYLAHREEQKARYNAWRSANPEKVKAYSRKNYLKVRARGLVGKAIRAGKIKRLPCQQCANPRSQAHHEDYLHPLDIKWLCASCHSAHHRKIVPLHMLTA